MRLLYVEDEIDILTITARRLAQDGFTVDTCTNGQDAWTHYLQQTPYDGIILDILLPGLDGFTLLARLRQAGCLTPVLMLTALDGVDDRIRGLEDGADDYLVKPFAYAELLARLRALLRRQPSAPGLLTDPADSPAAGAPLAPGRQAAPRLLTLANLVLNLDAWTVTRAGQPVALSQKEFTMLAYLLQNQGQILSREQIEHHVWTSDFEGGSNVVDVYIRYLRRKIDTTFSPPLIHTVRGVGYVLKVK